MFPSHIADKKKPIAFLSLGFRPFFLGAAIYAFSAILIWMANYSLNYDVGLSNLSSLHWHAHEMIFGYGMAVIAGFLLTAVSVWTGLSTVTGTPLLVMFILWACARMLPFMPISNGLLFMFIVDTLFNIHLIYAISKPVFKVRQWKQLGIISKIVLLLVANSVFYLGALGVLDIGVHWGIYAGIYLVLALILMMARRVIPFFIEKGCRLDTPLKNWRWLDITSLIIFLCFMISDIIYPATITTTALALVLALLHSMRLYLWYIADIWHKPLLWVLLIAYCFIILGFILNSAVYFLGISPYLALHAFALGGIGIMTIGMMARVSLGHTGRSVDQPTKLLTWVFLLLVLAAIVRVIAPLVDTGHYPLWIIVSQCLWIGAYCGFIINYFPILIHSSINND